MMHASKYVAAAKVKQAAKTAAQACASRFSGSNIQKQQKQQMVISAPAVLPFASSCQRKYKTSINVSVDMPLYRRSRTLPLSNMSRQFSSVPRPGDEEALQKKEEAATNQNDKRFFRGQLQSVSNQLPEVASRLTEVESRLAEVATQQSENSKQLTFQLTLRKNVNPDKLLDAIIGDATLHISPVVLDNRAPYTGRGEAIRNIRRAAKDNFNLRSCSSGDAAGLTYVNCPGHVRIGRTRTGEQAPQIIKDYIAESPSVFGDVPILDPAYIFISFKNGAGYNAKIDELGNPGADYGLGGRLLLAVFQGTDYAKYHEIPKIANMGALSSLRVFARILARALEGQPSNAVLPIVIHFDEYGHFIGQLKKAGFSDETAGNYFKAILYNLAPIMGCYDTSGLLAPFKNRYFVVPVTTGTSFVDVSVGMSQHTQLKAPLPVLSVEDSEFIVRSKLAKKFSDSDVDSIMSDSSFNVALGDAGGFPGFLEYLWRVDFADFVDTKNYVAFLSERVRGYISDDDKPQGWPLVVQLALTCVLVPDHFIVSDEITIRDLRDRGVVHLVEDNPGSGSLVELAPVMMGRWDAPIRVGSVVPCISDISDRNPWQWYRLEDCIVDYLQARLAALRTVSTHGLLESDEPGVATISEILPGAIFAQKSKLPGTRLELDEIDGCNSILNLHWIIQNPSKQRESKRIDRTNRNVHKTAENNPIVDGYVTLKKAGTEGTVTLFFQIRHSALSTDNPQIGVPAMNREKSNLDQALLRAQGWDVDSDHNEHALVFVSNRHVPESDVALSKNVGYISNNELKKFMGRFAHRGLLCPDDAVLTTLADEVYSE